MSADDADEKKPEVDPWADILSEDLGGVSENPGVGDGLGDVDDASAFNFLDGDDEAAASDLAAAEFPAAELPDIGLPAIGPAGPTAAAPPADGLPAGEPAGDPTEEFARELFAEADAEADLATDSPPLSVFAPEESAVSEPSPSTIEIGTGFSGIRLDEAEAAEEDVFARVAAGGEPDQATEPDDSFDVGGLPARDADESGFFANAGWDDSGEAAAEATGEEPFTAAAPAVAAAVTAPAAAGRVTTAKVPPKKKGGVGPVVGLVLGGLMAIPIVLGILIGFMWLGWPDRVGLRKSMPAALAFLLPPKQSSGLTQLPAVAPDAVPDDGRSSLDDVAVTDAADDVHDDQPAPMDALAAADTLPGIDALPDDALPGPGASDDDLIVSPTAVPSGSERASDDTVPGIDALAGIGTRPAPPDDFDAAVIGGEPAMAKVEPAAVVEPEPLDMAGLEAAILAAEEASAAAAALEDFADRGSRRPLIDWYRSLARVAAELALLERVAADSARPLAGAPDPVVALHATIAADGRLVEQLGRLAPMWLAFGKRDSDGVMLVGEFASTRPAGPWWRSRVIHPDGEGKPRDLTVITRTEPAAVAGERVFVTGVIIGDDVVWGTDCRAPREPDSARPEPDDIFGLPE